MGRRSLARLGLSGSRSLALGVLFSLAVAGIVGSPAQAEPTSGIEWIRQLGGLRPVVDAAQAVSADGSVYVAGRAGGAFPGETGAGGLDAFLKRYDAAGGEVWTRQFGTGGTDQAAGVATDGAGGVYVVGTFAPGGAADAFVRRYDDAGNVIWARQFGTSSADGALAVAADGSGGIYVAGQTDGTLPGQTSAGRSDVFLRRYDTAGNELWTRQFGSDVVDTGYGVAVDGQGGVYVAGSINFQGFVRRYDAAGGQVWDRQFGSGVGNNVEARSVAADDAGGVYVAGQVSGALAGQTSAGNFDPFVKKYDAAGGEVWTRQFGTSNADAAFGVGVDGAGGVYAAGRLASSSNAFPSDAMLWKYSATGDPVWTRQFGTAAADEASGVAVGAGGILVAGQTGGTFPGETSAGNLDGFVRRWDAAGNEVWTRQFGTLSPSAVEDAAFGVATDDAGGTYLAGWTNGALAGQTSAGSFDAFVKKYDAAGGEVWARQFGAAGPDRAEAVAVDGAGGVYVTGSTAPVSGRSDVFVRKYDAATGDELWARQFGTAQDDVAHGIAADAAGGVFVTGETVGAFPGHTNDGSRDVYLRRYDAAGNDAWTQQVESADTRLAFGVAADGAGGAYVAGRTDVVDETDPDRPAVSTGVLWRFGAAGDVVWERQGPVLVPQHSDGGVAVDGDGGVYVTGTVPDPDRDWEVYLRKHDAAGNVLWTRQFGTDVEDEVFGIAAGGGGVHVVGETDGTFEGAASAGGVDAFLRTYDAAGNELWTRQFGVTVGDRAWAVAADGAGRVSVAGETAPQPGADRNAFVARVGIIDLLYLHAQGTTLLLDPDRPTSATATSRDSAALRFAGGNPWKPVGTWTQTATGQARTLESLGDLRVWLGLRNSDDQGTRFDVRAELLRNGVPVASGETSCIQGATTNPANALQTFVSFGATGTTAVGPTDTLSLSVSARIGTDGSGAFCGGHASATGVRLYFDAQSRPSRLDLAFG